MPCGELEWTCWQTHDTVVTGFDQMRSVSKKKMTRNTLHPTEKRCIHSSCVNSTEHRVHSIKYLLDLRLEFPILQQYVSESIG